MCFLQIADRQMKATFIADVESNGKGHTERIHELVELR